MKEFKGTKGKWISRYNDKYWEVNREEDFKDGKSLAISVMVFEAKDGDYVFGRSGEARANAHLIATAPELLELAIKVQKFIQDYKGNINLQDYIGINIMMEEVINKALNIQP